MTAPITLDQIAAAGVICAAARDRSRRSGGRIGGG
jgi:hypothetical protein